MKTTHLTEVEIALCAEALATDSAANTVSDFSKKHLNHCNSCKKQVNDLAITIRQKYNDEIVIGLNNVMRKRSVLFSWIGL